MGRPEEMAPSLGSAVAGEEAEESAWSDAGVQAISRLSTARVHHPHAPAAADALLVAGFNGMSQRSQQE
jgi:hypothetical protein